MLLLLLTLIPAKAASPWTLPEGATSVYAGVGVSTFATGMSGFSRDRYLQSRLALWAGRGLGERTQLSLSLPLVHTRVLEDPDEGPCPSGDYCKPSTSLGSVEVAVQHRISGGGVPFAVRLGLFGDPWNAPTRGRWTNAGQGTFGGVVDAITGTSAGEDTRWATAAVLGLAVPVPQRATSASGDVRWLPAPTLRATVEGSVQHGIIQATVALHGHQRLYGEPYGPDWVRDWRPVLDRWRVTRWGEVRPELKLSVLHPGGRSGVHLAATWTNLVEF